MYCCSIAHLAWPLYQPALYEAFGLTVIEAMTCGLPTFATNQGGPAEIIVDGVSGFHIDPNHGDESSNKIADFFEKCKQDNQHWTKYSAAGLQRIHEWYYFPAQSIRIQIHCGARPFDIVDSEALRGKMLLKGNMTKLCQTPYIAESRDTGT